MKKAVLAFSGGLDTSFCVPYLKEKGYEVYAVTVDTGGFSSVEIKKIKNRAKELKVEQTSKNYSINKGMLGTTIGGKETKDSWELPPDEVFPTVVDIDSAPKGREEIVISFDKGLPNKINGKAMSGIDLMEYLDKLGAKHGVGKGMHVGNTILGIKGRIVFEAPAALILVKAHEELEKLVLTKWQSFWKDILSEAYGNFLHEGLYFDPVVKDIEALIDSSQSVVSGEAKLKLHKGNIIVIGVKSPYSLMDKKVATYGEQNLLWTGQDVIGFSKLYGLQSVLASNAKKIGDTYEKNKN